MKNKVSVVVTTKNRENDLKHCLGSLACQSKSLDELVIIDNNSSDSTKMVVKNFSKTVKFEVKYVLQRKIGYPCVYNRGLKEASFKWVAFIDDDCIAHPGWYKRICHTSERFPQVSAILGKSSEYFSNKTMSLVKAFVDETGKIGAIHKGLILDTEILDSKNIVYNKSFLDDNDIKFDEGLLKYAQGASEDCDLGMQIYKFKGIAIYDDKVLVKHKDPVGITAYYQKILFTLRNHLIYEKKWKNIRASISTQRSIIQKIRLFNKFRITYSLGKLKTIIVLINIVITYIYIKTARIMLEDSIESMRIKKE